MRTSALPEATAFNGNDYLVMDHTNRGTRRITGESIKAYVKTNECKRYGYRVNLNDPDPDTRVEYLYDAVDMVPAFMNFIGEQFYYGSWGDIWFVRDNYPCMMTFGGQVDYALDPNDYTKKTDGTPSDVSNSAYRGNAMSAIPRIWYKRWEENGYRYFVCAEDRYDETYHADVFMKPDGTVGDHKYVGMYDGAVVDSTVRSISGVMPAAAITFGDLFTCCQNGGDAWAPYEWETHCLIADLLTLMSKSTNHQLRFGYGVSTGSTILDTGSLNSAGQFCGYRDSTHAVKVFHIENPWGNIEKLVSGIYLDHGTPVCRGDHVDNPVSKELQGTLKLGEALPTTTNGSIANLQTTRWGYLPKEIGGNNSGGECSAYTSYLKAIYVRTLVGCNTYDPEAIWIGGSTYKYVTVFDHNDTILELSVVYLAVGGSSSESADDAAGMYRFTATTAPETLSANVGTRLSCSLPV